jgi:hypothetical protein
MLEQIRFVSTVSGGSLGTGLVYSAAGNRWPTSKEYLEQLAPRARHLLTHTNVQRDLVLGTLTRPWLLLKGRAQLVSESMQHIWFSDKRNPRLATVESVMALEAAIKELLPRFIRRLPGNPNPAAESLDKLIQEAGLRLVTSFVLEMLGETIGVSPQDIRLCQAAVERRNAIMHNGQRQVSIQEAETYVDAIDRVITALTRGANELA